MTTTLESVCSASQLSLPRGWKFVRLGDCTSKIGSGLTPRGGQSAYKSSGIPFIRSQNVYPCRFAEDGLAFITTEQDEDMSQSRVQKGDVLLNITGASIGRACLVPDDMCPANVNQHVSIIRCETDILPPFLAFYFATPQFQKFVDDTQAGATRQALTKGLIENFSIPVPPLDEQRRIVAVLQEQMAAVERARAAAEARLEAAEALLPALLDRAFAEDEVRNAPDVRLGDVLHLRKDIVHPRDNPCGPAKFVGLEHVESGTGIRLGEETVEMAELTGRKPRFYEDDIVYGYLRPYLNKVWVAEFDGLCSVDQYVYAVDGERAVTEYIAWYMRSPAYLRRSPIGKTPGWLPRIRIEEVAAVEVPLPPVSVQRSVLRRITTDVHAALSVCTNARNELNEINALPAALLRQAFDGEV